MNNSKIVMVGGKEIKVDDATYAALRSEMERVKKKKQRLRKDGIEYEVKSLNAMYDETEFEPASDNRVEDSVFRSILAERLWDAVNSALGKKDAFVITAYHKDRMPEQEIADILGVTQQMVSKRRKKAEDTLADALGDFKIFLE